LGPLQNSLLLLSPLCLIADFFELLRVRAFKDFICWRLCSQRTLVARVKAANAVSVIARQQVGVLPLENESTTKRNEPTQSRTESRAQRTSRQHPCRRCGLFQFAWQRSNRRRCDAEGTGHANPDYLINSRAILRSKSASNGRLRPSRTMGAPLAVTMRICCGSDFSPTTPI